MILLNLFVKLWNHLHEFSLKSIRRYPTQRPPPSEPNRPESEGGVSELGSEVPNSDPRFGPPESSKWRQKVSKFGPPAALFDAMMTGTVFFVPVQTLKTTVFWKTLFSVANLRSKLYFATQLRTASRSDPNSDSPSRPESPKAHLFWQNIALLFRISLKISQKYRRYSSEYRSKYRKNIAVPFQNIAQNIAKISQLLFKISLKISQKYR